MYSVAKHVYMYDGKADTVGFAIDKENLRILGAQIDAMLIDEGKPDKKKKYAGPDQHQSQHYPAHKKEAKRGSLVCTDHRSALEALHKVKTGEEFRASKNSRDDRSEAQGRPENIFKWRKQFSADIRPILGADIEQFEDPPNRRRNKEQPHIFAQTTRE